MGEEEKKPQHTNMDVQIPAPEDLKASKQEQTKPIDKKSAPDKDDQKTEESKDAKDAATAAPPPPPPPEIVLKVYMHCEGCARKVRRCLRGFEGVEDVITDCKTHKVIVKGEKADPLKVLDRVQRKSHRNVELLSPIPSPPAPEKPAPVEEKEKPKIEDKKEEPPQLVTVVLRVHMHCEGCAQEIKKRILRMKGVESVEPDLKGSQVSVTGVFDPQKLVDYAHRRTGKHVVMVKTDPEKKDKEPEVKEVKEEKVNEEKKGGDGEGKEGNKEADGGGGGGGEAKVAGDAAAPAAAEESKAVELIKNEYQFYPQRYAMEMYAYPPQIFSDENPNACSVM